MFDGLRVLDLSEEPGWLTGKILGDLGAGVVKVEPPGGDRVGRRGPFLAGQQDPERSLPWLALNTSKRGITLDCKKQDGQRLLRELSVKFDVLLETFAPGQMAQWGVGFETLREANPRLVYCAVTPFGQTGPLFEVARPRSGGDRHGRQCRGYGLPRSPAGALYDADCLFPRRPRGRHRHRHGALGP